VWFVASAREALGASSFTRSLDVGEEMKRFSRDGSIDVLSAVARDFAATAKAEASMPSGEVWATRFGLVARAVGALEGNGSPQLVGEALLSRLRRT
jgi:hypothetical protein